MVKQHAHMVQLIQLLKFITLVKYVSQVHKQDTGTDLG